MFTPYTLVSRPTATPTLLYRTEPKIAKFSSAFEPAPPISMTIEFNPVAHVDVRYYQEDAKFRCLL
jgi:hypothetical protein